VLLIEVDPATGLELSLQMHQRGRPMTHIKTITVDESLSVNLHARKVLLVTSSAIPHVGGLSTHFELLESELRRAAVETESVTGNQLADRSFSRRAITRLCGVDYSRAKTAERFLALLTRRLKKVLHRFDPDMIHTHDAIATCAAFAALRAPGICPVIQTIHGPLSREAMTSGARSGGRYVSTLREMERVAYLQATRLLAVDTGQRDLAIADYDVDPSKIAIIPNAVDVDAVQTEASGEGRLTPKRPYFLLPRRLVPKNGVAVAIQALGLLEQSDVGLVLAGDGPLRNDLLRAASELGLGDRVRFAGDVSHEDLMPLMRRSAAVLIPSVPSEGVIEATSLSLLEGLACGAPVIASNLGGLAEILSNAQDGHLFEPGDSGQLAEHMRAVLHMSAANREKVVRDGLARVRARFGVHCWFQQIMDNYACAHAALHNCPSPHDHSDRRGLQKKQGG
jgi:glycosyltransferase involved in cell wall biosynthesis